MERYFSRRWFFVVLFVVMAVASIVSPPNSYPIWVKYCTVWAGHADREYAYGWVVGWDRYGLQVRANGKTTWIRYDQVVWK